MIIGSCDGQSPAGRPQGTARPTGRGPGRPSQGAAGQITSARAVTGREEFFNLQFAEKLHPGELFLQRIRYKEQRQVTLHEVSTLVHSDLALNLP